MARKLAFTTETRSDLISISHRSDLQRRPKVNQTVGLILTIKVFVNFVYVNVFFF